MCVVGGRTGRGARDRPRRRPWPCAAGLRVRPDSRRAWAAGAPPAVGHRLSFRTPASWRNALSSAVGRARTPRCAGSWHAWHAWLAGWRVSLQARPVRWCSSHAIGPTHPGTARARGTRHFCQSRTAHRPANAAGRPFQHPLLVPLSSFIAAPPPGFRVLLRRQIFRCGGSWARLRRSESSFWISGLLNSRSSISLLLSAFLRT